MVRSHSISVEFCLVKAWPSWIQGDGDDIPEIMNEFVSTARDMELEINEVDIEELVMEHENDLIQKNSKNF